MPDASEQDKTIARVVLAGVDLRKWEIARYRPTYRVFFNDIWIATAPTRYTAALKAEQWLDEHHKLEALLPPR